MRMQVQRSAFPCHCDESVCLSLTFNAISLLNQLFRERFQTLNYQGDMQKGSLP